MRSLARLLCVAAFIAGGCSSPQQTVAIDSSFKTVVEDQQQGPRILAHLKPQPDGGRLSLCGALVVETRAGDPKPAVDELENPASYVEIGQTGLRVQTRLFPIYVATPGQNEAALSPATCQRTGAPWRDEYAATPLTLHLVSPVTAPRQLRIPGPGHL